MILSFNNLEINMKKKTNDSGLKTEQKMLMQMHDNCETTGTRQLKGSNHGKFKAPWLDLPEKRTGKGDVGSDLFCLWSNGQRSILMVQ